MTPKSVHPQRMRENLAAAELKLLPEDMQALTGLERAYRFLTGGTWAPPGSPYTVAELWGEG